MNALKISPPASCIKTSAILPVSKSECNRALIIGALSDGKVKVSPVSSARDTQTLLSLLGSKEEELDVRDAGTTMRFLLAYFCLKGRACTLTGSPRMKQRPIGPLAEALQQIGFPIKFPEQEGFPPVRIYPAEREKLLNRVEIRGDISSQYISALLMIAPSLPNGLSLTIAGEILSRPYIEMTREMLLQAGIRSRWEKQVIYIEPQEFDETTLVPEADWSAASYWYAIAALSDDSEIALPGLLQNSMQGDSAISRVMEDFGVETIWDNEIIILRKTGRLQPPSIIDFSGIPDLCQTLAVVCAGLSIPIHFTGLKTLRVKETDRIAALQNELAKCSIGFIEKGGDLFELSGQYVPPQQSISTYHDHRMAMSFAALATKTPIVIEDPEVVEKSYPGFWGDLASGGFALQNSVEKRA